jgi:hypothetical protein
MASFAPPVINWSQLAGIGQDFEQGFERGRERSILANLGVDGNYEAAARRLMATGNLDRGIALANLARQDQERRDTLDLTERFGRDLLGQTAAAPRPVGAEATPASGPATPARSGPGAGIPTSMGSALTGQAPASPPSGAVMSDGEPLPLAPLPTARATTATPTTSQPANAQQGSPVIPGNVRGLTGDPVRLALYAAHPRASEGMRQVARQMLDSWMQANRPTDETREYLLAVAQGETSRFTDWSIRRRQASATRVTQNNNQSAETAEAQARGRGIGDRMNGIVGDLDTARQDALVTQQLAQAMSNIEPGARTAALNALRERTGIAIDPNAAQVQAAEALVNYMGPRLRVPGSGAQSDRELQNFLSSLPSIRGTAEGNELVIRTIGGLNQYRVARGQIAQDWQAGRIDASEAFRRMDALPDPFDQFRQWQQQNTRRPQQPGQGPQQPAGGDIQWRMLPAGSPAPATPNIQWRMAN